MTDTYEIYLGLGGPDAVDYAQPVASRMGPGPVDVQVDLAPGTRYVLGARAISPAGVRERNTHVLACVEVGADGALPPPPPPQPRDVTAEPTADGAVRVEWTACVAAGRAVPDAFDVLSDDGTGTVDPHEPVATIDNPPPGQEEFACELPAPPLPLRLAVRARAAGRTGPPSRVVRVAAPPAPAPAVLL
ncbi:MAG: hypothetical protein ACOC8F_04220 [Planctomycetota bacterium]